MLDIGMEFLKSLQSVRTDFLNTLFDIITFLVAWIENNDASNVDYENVLDFWLT